MKPQPIETAPKDGTHILLYGSGQWVEGWWTDGRYGGWTTDWNDWGEVRHVTAWLPLPEKPEWE